MPQYRGRRFRIMMAASGAAIAISLVPLRSAPIQTQAQPAAPAAAVTTGVREAAWSPDSKRIAASWFDAIWTMTPDGKDPKRLVAATQGWAAERDPAWSPDGKQIAFSASTNGEFDVWVAPATGGAARRITNDAGDERWPSWTKDGRSLVISRRNPKGSWMLEIVPAEAGVKAEAVRIGDSTAWQGAVSPDGTRVAFVSDRAAEANNEADIWAIDLTPTQNGSLAPPVRVTSAPGDESHPTWSPNGTRVAFAASRNGI
ncbi:MAG TPA: LpqB family beta-propeller domain-containing protein, partial [Vicinamibacterales bacterium]|nr:LpqB family beta-propeller domain-containing protein [Vicinamibacterales bacterium]